MGRWSVVGIACAAALLVALLVRDADVRSTAPEPVVRVPKGSASGEEGSGEAALADAPVDAEIDQRAALEVEAGSESADVDAARSGADDTDVAGGVTVEGRVLDPSGQPVEGASILVHRPRTAAGPESISRTGPDGRFSVADASPGSRIGARKVGWAPTFAVALGADCAHEVSLELRFVERSGTLRGVVVDPRGAPVASAIVVVEEAGPHDGWVFESIPEDAPRLPPGCHWERSVARMQLVTDEGGAFELPDALPGHVEVRVRARGRLDAKAYAEIEHGAVTALRVELPDGATLVGRATWADGSPVKKKQIRLRGERAFRSSTRVDSLDGSFRLERLPAGELSVRVAWLSRGSAQTDVTLVDGRETRCDLVLQEHVDLEGTLVAETGEPLADWIVLARGSGSYRRRRRSDDAGHFELDGVAPSADRLEVWSRSSLLGDYVVLAVDPWTLPRPLRLVVPSREVPGSTVRFSIEPAVADASATVVCLDDDERSGWRRIAADGTWAAEDLPAGRYRLLVEVDDTPALTSQFELRPRQVLDLGALTLPPRGEVDFQATIAGSTTFERSYLLQVLDGRGVELDHVYVDGPENPFGPIPAGRYRLVSDVPEVAPLDVEFDVVAGETRTVEVELVPATSRRFRIDAVPSTQEFRTVTFRLFDAAGAQVRSRSLKWNAALVDDRIHWDEPSLVPGRYTLEVRDDVGRVARAAFEIETVDRPTEGTPAIPLTLRAP